MTRILFRLCKEITLKCDLNFDKELMFCCMSLLCEIPNKRKRLNPQSSSSYKVVAAVGLHSDYRKTSEMTTSAAAAAVEPAKNASSERPALPMM